MRSLLVGLLFFGVVFSANAVYTVNSTGTIITDNSAGGLEWLALTETRGLAFNDALTGRTGWRYATYADMTRLFNDYFSTVPFNQFNYYSGSDALITATVQEFQSDFGITTVFNQATYSWGWYLSESQSFPYPVGNAGVSITPSLTQIIGQLDVGNYSQDTTQSTYNGTFLVRDAVSSVPESASIFLLAFGLLSLLGFAKQKS